MRWAPDASLWVSVQLPDSQQLQTHKWEVLPRRFLTAAQSYYDLHLANKVWKVESIVAVRFTPRAGYEYEVRWEGFPDAPTCSSVVSADSICSELAAQFWEIDHVMASRKKGGRVEVHCRHKHECAGHVGSTDYWYDYADALVTDAVKEAWKETNRETRKQHVLQHGGACVYDCTHGEWPLTASRLEARGSMLVAELKREFSAALWSRLWLIMVVDQIRKPTLMCTLWRSLLSAMCESEDGCSGRFLGGSVCHYLKVSWVVPETSQTVEVGDDGKPLADVGVAPARIEVPRYLHLDDLRGSESNGNFEVQPAVLIDGEGEPAEGGGQDEDGNEKVKRSTRGLMFEWSPQEAAILFGTDPHRWRPVQVVNRTTKWYRVSSNHNLRAEWLDGVFQFMNLHIHCADSVRDPETDREVPREVPLVQVPLKRKNVSLLCVADQR